MQQSADSADTSGASSGGGADQADSTATKSTKSLKALWKKAIRKLTPRLSRSTDEDKTSPTNANAGYLYDACLVISCVFCVSINQSMRFISGSAAHRKL